MAPYPKSLLDAQQHSVHILSQKRNVSSMHEVFRGMTTGGSFLSSPLCKLPSSTPPPLSLSFPSMQLECRLNLGHRTDERFSGEKQEQHIL